MRDDVAVVAWSTTRRKARIPSWLSRRKPEAAAATRTCTRRDRGVGPTPIARPPRRRKARARAHGHADMMQTYGLLPRRRGVRRNATRALRFTRARSGTCGANLWRDGSVGCDATPPRQGSDRRNGGPADAQRYIGACPTAVYGRVWKPPRIRRARCHTPRNGVTAHMRKIAPRDRRVTQNTSRPTCRRDHHTPRREVVIGAVV